MAPLKLYYFPVKAIGEGARLLLAYGQEEYEDIRIESEKWPNIKKDMPFGVMPVLEVDGVKYSDSIAIVRFLGHKYGLGGKTLLENLEIDQNLHYLCDIRLAGQHAWYLPDSDMKEQVKQNLKKNFYPDAFKRLNEIIIKNNGHLALGKLTFADFMFAGVYDRLKFLVEIPDLDEQYPAFRKLQQKVFSIPQVKAYLPKAPNFEW